MSGAGFPQTILRLAACAVLLAAAVWQLLFALQEQRDFLGGRDLKITAQTRNLVALNHQARQQHMLEADLPRALVLLQQALRVNPSYVPAWLSLAEVQNDMGQKTRASATLDYADTLTQGLKRWRWDKALTAYQLGRMDMLPAELHYIVSELPGRQRTAALQLAFTLWPEPAELLSWLGYDNINHLLAHAVANKLSAPALFFWQRMELGQVPWQEREALALIDMLIGQGLLAEATAIWRGHFNREELLHNGNFSRPFLGRAFGWRAGKSQHFVLKLVADSADGPGRAVHCRFKGWENINFNHLYQIVPLTGGESYRLQATLRSEKMTTNQRPYLEVSGYRCTMPVAAAAMVAPDQGWQDHQLTFTVPEECAAVVVRLRRQESSHIDNKLAGQLWLRDVMISQLAGARPPAGPAPP